MSWLARSLVNSLKVSDDDDDDFFDEDDDDYDNTNSNLSYNDNHRNQNRESKLEEEYEYEIDESEENQGRGVKEDLSDLTKTLTRQLIGVASFLAPPPPPPPPLPPLRSSSSRSNLDSSKSDWNLWEKSRRSMAGEKSDQTVELSDSERVVDGFDNELAENDGRFRNQVNESLLPMMNALGLEESEDKYPIGGAVGVTDEVLVFARNIAMHPETWLDFPLADDEEFGEDYDMSDAQYEHALAVERLAPRFAALRIELCPRHMSEECFWKTYFVLLHPRLNKHDAELLSTQQIVEARAMLMQELQERTKPEPDWLRRPMSYSTEPVNSPHSHVSASSDTLDETMPLNKFIYDTPHSVSTTDYEATKYPVANSEMSFIDKSVVEEAPIIHNRNKNLLADVQKILDEKYEDDSDDWLEESSEMGDYVRTTIPLGHEEDVSFSDLEDDGSSINFISRQRMYTFDTLSAKDGHPAATGYLGSKQS